MLKNLKIGIAALVVGLTACSTAHSETFRYGNILYDEQTPDFIYLAGPISYYQGEDFRTAFRKHEFSTIVLNSGGGSVYGGLTMARYIRSENINTIIPRTGICASACSYLFYAGVERSAIGDLGVHQFASDLSYLTQTLDTETSEVLLPIIEAYESETQELSGEIIKLLNEFNTPPFVFEKMLTTHSGAMYWLDAAERKVSSIGGACLADQEQAAPSSNNFASIVTSSASKNESSVTSDTASTCENSMHDLPPMVETLSEIFVRESALMEENRELFAFIDFMLN